MPDDDRAKNILTEEITSGGTPTLPGKEAPAAAIAPNRATLAAGATQEYVAGGAGDPLFAYSRALPGYIDDLTQAFGPDLYERMARDPHVAGETSVYKLSVLANGVRLIPAIDGVAVKEKDDGFKRAEKVRRLCEAALSELDTPLGPVLEDMLDAFGQGNRVAEVVYRQDGGERLMPHRLKVKPREVTAFVVDNRRNVIGLLGALAGRSQVVLRESVIVDPSVTPNLLPRSKFAVLTFRSRNADPRGTSAYHPAYDPWWLKQQTLSEFAKFIAQFAGAGIVASTAEGAQPQQQRNADGSFAFDTAGNPIMVEPSAQLLTALLNWRNGQALVVPYGSEIKNLVAVGAGTPFLPALDYYDRQISKAILGQTLATNEGQHESRAASGNSKDVMDLLIQQGEEATALMIRRDLLRVFLTINFGDAALRFLPLVSLSAVEEADFSQMASGVASLKTSGFLRPNQEDALANKLGLPAGEGEVEQPQKTAPDDKPAGDKPAKDEKDDAQEG